MRMAAARDQGDGRKLNAGIGEQNGMDVTFDMVYGNERNMPGETKRFGIGNANEERADQTRAFSDRDRAQIIELHSCLVERLAHDWNNRAQLLARSEFRYDAPVPGVYIQLRCDHGRSDVRAIFNHGGRSFITRALDS